MTKLLKDLEWPTLQQRRMEARLINFYKAMNRDIPLEFPPQIQTKRRATRSYHAKSLIQPSCSYCRTNLYQNSFFPKTIRDWNALPETAAMASFAEAFAAVLKEYTADSEHLFNIFYYYILLLVTPAHHCT